VPSAATLVALGNLRDPQTALAIFGLMLTAALLALIIVGSFMMTTITEIAWTDPVVSLPAFLTNAQGAARPLPGSQLARLRFDGAVHRTACVLGPRRVTEGPVPQNRHLSRQRRRSA
jgi:hypothetical protein